MEIIEFEVNILAWEVFYKKLGYSFSFLDLDLSNL